MRLGGGVRQGLRWALLAIALALVLVVVWDYGRRSLARGRVTPEDLPVLPVDIAAQSQSWQWTQTAGDSAQIQVNAEDFAQGSGGRATDLWGVELKVFRDGSPSYDRVESAAMRMLADGKLESAGETVITLGVPGGPRRGPLAVVNTTEVTFHTEDSSARTEQLVHYQFSGASGTSVGALYDAASLTLEMLAEVRLEGHPREAGSPPAGLQAGRLLYSEEAQTVHLSDGARLERGPMWIECERARVLMLDGRVRGIECGEALGGETLGAREIRFEAPVAEAQLGPDSGLLAVTGTGGARVVSAAPGGRIEVQGRTIRMHYERTAGSEEARLRSIVAHGDALAGLQSADDGTRTVLTSEGLRIRLSQPAGGIETITTVGPGKLEWPRSPGEASSQRLEAGRVRLEHGPGGGLERVYGTAGAHLVQGATVEGGMPLETWGDELVVRLDPLTSEMLELRLTGAFRFEEGPRRGSAHEAHYLPETGTLELTGEAHVADADGTVDAGRIAIGRLDGALEARGSVTGSLQPTGTEDDRDASVDLFGGDGPVFLVADSLTADPAAGTILYEGGARLWQGTSSLHAARIAVASEGTGVEADRAVTLTWNSGQLADGPGDSAVQVSAEHMVYASTTGTARFEGAVELRRSGLLLRSQRLETGLGEGSGPGGGESMASGSVRLEGLQAGQEFRGFAERADLGADGGAVTLTGDPAIILTPDGTRSEGGSLTYSMTGDSLLVSGGSQRAYTHRPASR